MAIIVIILGLLILLFFSVFIIDHLLTKYCHENHPVMKWWRRNIIGVHVDDGGDISE